jgi:hypothetical protein
MEFWSSGKKLHTAAPLLRVHVLNLSPALLELSEGAEVFFWPVFSKLCDPCGLCERKLNLAKIN